MKPRRPKRSKLSPPPEVKEALWSALTSLASAPPEQRTLTGLAVLLQSNALKAALMPYTLEGPFGRLLDAAEDCLLESIRRHVPDDAHAGAFILGTSLRTFRRRLAGLPAA